MLHDRDAGLELTSMYTVAVIGVGGVGSWVAYLLANSDMVENMILIDPDVVEDSNLPRTPYRKKDVGELKVYAMKNIIDELGMNIDVVAIPEKSEDVEIAFNRMTTIDCRDFVAPDIRSDIVAGYDGKSMTVHINPDFERVFHTVNEHGYTVPSYIVPPVLMATIIVEYLLNHKVRTFKEVIKTFTTEEFMTGILDYEPQLEVRIEDDEGKLVGKHTKFGTVVGRPFAGYTEVYLPTREVVQMARDGKTTWKYFTDRRRKDVGRMMVRQTEVKLW